MIEKVTIKWEKMSINSRIVPFAQDYIIYNDGRCYSLKTNKFLKKVAIKSRSKTSTVKHYYYDFGFRKFLVNRLVMFMFGKHQYIDIDKMPIVTAKNNNVEDHYIDNLKFTNIHNVIEKTILSYDREINKALLGNRRTINILFLPYIEKLVSNNVTYAKIAEMFGTSEMSVYRYVKKFLKVEIPNV